MTSATPSAPAASLLPTVEHSTGETPHFSVIWLHGLGADGHDFEPIVEEFDLDRLPPIRFIFPHAPMRAVTINGGYVMRAWYDVVSPDFAPGREEAEGVRQSTAQIEALLARENERGIPAERIVLAGFSQGGAVALHAGLRHAQRLAGVLALSCYLPLADTLADEAHASNRQVPLFMAHGRNDPVVPYDYGKRSAKLLKAEGYPVEWYAYDSEHTVCVEELGDIESWLHRIVSAAC
ncbi:MAG: dienelactone hydrolase family protein [Candidatus Accumulibacter sp.]|uniref:alpha/beta hydrolase n=1 Tax=Accumulibacter sp. TaxID=2053492 RepID=UPI0028783CA7|nr:alpha/beta fold hydrolase [Accumulibacter sp.]MDS4014222.1 dienelactone hydrolase family protein [Accumulibacter sp.]